MLLYQSFFSSHWSIVTVLLVPVHLPEFFGFHKHSPTVLVQLKQSPTVLHSSFKLVGRIVKLSVDPARLRPKPLKQTPFEYMLKILLTYLQSLSDLIFINLKS
jgi:hypothetical protein